MAAPTNAGFARMGKSQAGGQKKERMRCRSPHIIRIYRLNPVCSE